MEKNEGLKQLISYKKGFAFSRMVVFISLIANVIVVLFAIVFTSMTIAQERNKIAVLSTKGPINDAIMVDRSRVRKFEYLAVMKDVFRYLYQHDENDFHDRLEMANNILGAPGIRVTKEFKQENYYKRLREYNLIMKVQITDARVDEQKKVGQISGIQTMRWQDETRQVKYKVVCRFRDMVANSEKNPHGIKIVEWEEIEEQPIEEK